MSAHSKPTSLGQAPPRLALVLLLGGLAACSSLGIPDAAFEPLDLTIEEHAGGPYEVAQTFTPLATGRLIQLDLWVRDTAGDAGSTVSVEVAPLTELGLPAISEDALGVSTFDGGLAGAEHTWVEVDFRDLNVRLTEGQLTTWLATSPGAEDLQYSFGGDTFDTDGRPYEDGAICDQYVESSAEGEDPVMAWSGCEEPGDLGFRVWVQPDA